VVVVGAVLEEELKRVVVVQARLPQLRLDKEESLAICKAARLVLGGKSRNV
jgi:hypothetical protein